MILAVGNGFTVTVTDCGAVEIPQLSVTTTVYVVVVVGDTDIVDVAALVLHKYVNGPAPTALALSVDELPTHIVPGAAVGTDVGADDTVTVAGTKEVLEQPAALVTVT